MEVGNVAVQRKTGDKNTRQLVRQIMVEQIAAGEDAGPTRIRQIIDERYGYSPSPNLVGEEIRNFWIKEGPEMVRKMQIPNIPDPVVDAFRSVWEASLLAANEGLESLRSEVEQRVQAAQGEVAESSERLAEAVRDLTAANSALVEEMTRNEKLSERAQAAENKLAATEAHLSGAEQKIVEMECSAANERNRFNEQIVANQAAQASEIGRLVASHEAEIKRLTEISARDAEAWEGVRRHLLMETDLKREAFKSELRALSGALDAAKGIESALRRERTIYEAQLATAKGQLAQRDADFIRLESRMATLLSSPAAKKRPTTYRPARGS
jgi:septal ring factor EnvC (AmiA/AmiB activator)